MFINPNNNRRIDTSATYTHRTWNHQPNNPLLAPYERVSSKVQEYPEYYDGTPQEFADLYETTAAHMLNFYRTYEPTAVALRLENGRYVWRLLQSEFAYDYFETVSACVKFALDISLHPMLDQAVAFAKTFTCPNKRRTFARQFNQRLRLLNDRTVLAEVKNELGQKDYGWFLLARSMEQKRLEDARKLNELL